MSTNSALVGQLCPSVASIALHRIAVRRAADHLPSFPAVLRDALKPSDQTSSHLMLADETIPGFDSSYIPRQGAWLDTGLVVSQNASIMLGWILRRSTLDGVFLGWRWSVEWVSSPASCFLGVTQYFRSNLTPLWDQASGRGR